MSFTLGGGYSGPTAPYGGTLTTSNEPSKFDAQKNLLWWSYLVQIGLMTWTFLIFWEKDKLSSATSNSLLGFWILWIFYILQYIYRLFRFPSTTLSTGLITISTTTPLKTQSSKMQSVFNPSIETFYSNISDMVFFVLLFICWISIFSNSSTITTTTTDTVTNNNNLPPGLLRSNTVNNVTNIVCKNDVKVLNLKGKTPKTSIFPLFPTFVVITVLLSICFITQVYIKSDIISLCPNRI